MQRRRRRRAERMERQNRAAKVLQRFFKIYPKLHKQRSMQKHIQEGTPKKRGASDAMRPRDETPWELPSVQVVREMHAKITAHIVAWRSSGGLQRPRNERDLQGLSEQANARMAEMQAGLARSRKEFVARLRMRQDIAACYTALRNCHGLEQLEHDTDLEACAKGQRYVPGIYDKEYAEFVESAARIEHQQLLKAVTTGNLE